MDPDKPTDLNGPTGQVSASATVTVVVPVYNGSQTLVELIERLTRVMDRSSSAYEVILVDDGSQDESWKTIEQLTQSRPECRGIGLSRNYGQHNALLAGIRQAQYDVIVTLDDDLQNPPEEVPVLLAALASGADVVYGTPSRPAFGLARRLSSRITKIVLKDALGVENAGSISSFRAFSSVLRDGFENVTGPAINIDVLLSWSTSRYQVVNVRHDERTIGRSNYTFQQLVRHALNMLTGYSTQPLRIASIIGFGFTLIGVGVFAYVVERYFQTGRAVPGFAFLASIISIFAGAQLFTLGIIGEYLARMYQRALDKPSYRVGRWTPERPRMR